MRRRAPLLPRVVAGATVVLALAALSGCSDDSPAAGPAAPADAPEADPTDAGVTTSVGDEEVSTFRGLPPGFPSEEVPLVARGKVVSGSSTAYDDVTAYTVVVRSGDQPRSSVRAALTTLTDAGLRGDDGLPAGEGAPPPRVLHTDGYDLVVTFSAVRSGPGSLLTYTVEES